MPRRGNIAIASFFFFAAIAAACVGSDPAPSSGNGDGDGGGSSGASSGASSGGSSGASCKGDEPTACGTDCKQCPVPLNGKATCTAGACGIECDASTTKCGDACAVLGSDGDHCGACDHACGGGACLQGVCQPVPVIQGLSGPASFDVDDTKLVYSATDLLASCDLPAGCGAIAPKKLAEGYHEMRDVRIAGSEVFWVGSSQGDSTVLWIRRCDINGCPAVPTTVFQDTSESTRDLVVHGNTVAWRTLSGVYIRSCTLPTCSPFVLRDEANTNVITGLATDGTSIYFGIEGGGGAQLYKCPAGSLCANPVPLSNGRLAGPMVVQNGLLYVADPGSASGINDGYVVSTPAAAAGAVATIGREELSPISVAADADGVYWANTNLAHVRTCPLNGCVGAPRELAKQQAGVKLVRAHGKFVYWMTNDAIYKVAK